MSMKPSVRLLFDYLEAAGITTNEDRANGVIAEVVVKYTGSGAPVEITVTRVTWDVPMRRTEFTEVRYVPADEPPAVPAGITANSS